jgi:hypothetical protein
MGFGIQPGEYFQSITPADIAPTLGALCSITLSSRDGHILSEALKKRLSGTITGKAALGRSTSQ